ncbi:MAG: RIP metalloprotease RseP [Candidatus Margulisiibacteriota bacterium]|jgi:regulator of sigma E protease
MISVIIFLIILSLLVFVHEFGHFTAAKKFGMKVDEFGFGFPPRARKLFEKNGTLYTLNWLPLGGFVKIKGEAGDSRDDSDSFAHKKIWQRFIVLVAGVSMNFVLAWILLTIGFAIGLPQVVDDTNSTYVTDAQIQVVSIEKDSPAESAGLELGDVIFKINDNEFSDIGSLQNFIADQADNSLTINIKRGKEIIEKSITPKILPDMERPVMGVGLVKTGTITYPLYRSVWEGAKATVFSTMQILFAFGNMIKNLFVNGSLGADIAGPVGIAVLTGQVVNLGFIYILQFAALLSINLAIINILPFPALDGGRVVFLLIEKVLRRPVDQKVEAIVHNLGFALLMLLVVVITFRDIGRFTPLWEGIKNLF